MSGYYQDFKNMPSPNSPRSLHVPHHDLRRAREDFAVVTVIFNPRGFASRYRLYRQFAERVRAANTRLFTVEVALGDRPFEVTDRTCDWHLQLRTGWELWHKERALNVGFQHVLRLMPDCRYLAWIDADVTFARHDWPESTCESLQHHKVVQMFGEAVNLDPDEHQQWSCHALFRDFYDLGHWHERRSDRKARGHPGLAWAARRETLDKLGGLIDFAISGSGDSHMANLLMGYRTDGDSCSTLSGFSDGFLGRLNAWADLADEVVRQNVGYVPGVVLHHWHGKSQARGHKTRWDAAKAHGFDPNTDLLPDCNGLYRLRPGREKMGDDIRRSLAQRDEDSTDV